MAQHDYVLDNQNGLSFRADLNNALLGIVSNNSGSSEPTTMYSYQWWSDTTTNLLKIRNSGNTAWITVASLITGKPVAYREQLSSVSGTNAITATASTTISSYTAGQWFDFIAAGANTGSVTININSLGNKTIYKDYNSTLVANDIKSGQVVSIFYDGTNFQLNLGAGSYHARTDTAQNFTAPQRAALTTDNDLSFDLSAKQTFKCTPTADGTLTFTNIPDGLSGSVLLINSSNYTISSAATTKISDTARTRISATGTYRIDFITDGTNVYCTASENLA